ncbi:MAG: N-acetyl-gamma-glutamyl-phosphate reductase [Defluviitaleaceae bacterium]|nr:N-acetyl-gamma-glutamyl-phosphate reductase [Defluviitaleaceae bacterium]
MSLINKINVFIDGNEGTTGLELENKLKKRKDIRILKIDEEKRKDLDEKSKIMDEADVIFLCLPEAAAIETVKIAPKNKIVIDASTAHRIDYDWVYGLPEISKEQKLAISNSKRISVPGCHATGFISLVYPLVKAGFISSATYLSCTSITGYSGGGKYLINKYETENINAPMPYSLGLMHKHLPEMQIMCDLANPPHFLPIVGNFFRGMLVTVPIFGEKSFTVNEIWAALARHYNDSRFISVKHFAAESHTTDGFLNPTLCNETNNMDIFVFGHDEQMSLIARLDNLGKGASGAAIQCMNIALGLSEDTEL